MPQKTLDYINSKVIDACDGLDGIHDDVLENPLDCKFDISTLACDSSQNSTECLTSDQIKAYHLIRNGPHNARTNQPIYPGFVHGSEVSWDVQQGELSKSYGQPLLKNMLSANLSFDPMMFNWDSDIALTDRKISPLIDSMGTNLTAFKSRGGKLLVSQGWADPYNAQTLQIVHLSQVAKDTGAKRGLVGTLHDTRFALEFLYYISPELIEISVTRGRTLWRERKLSPGAVRT